jgi:putative drug exporter of the RND superfamily
MIERLALIAFRHRFRTLLIWFAMLAVIIVGGGAVAGEFANGGRLTGTDSDAAYQLLDKHFPSTTGEYVPIAYQSPVGVDDPKTKQVIAEFVRATEALPDVEQVAGLDTSQVSGDGRVAAGSLVVTAKAEDQEKTAAMIRKNAAVARAKGVNIDFASWGFVEGGLNSTAEIVGVIAAVLILLMAFGSIVAMGVPIISALMGVAGAASLVGVWASVVQTPSFTTEVSLMIGLGVGIDYAVFIITRYRHALALGKSPEAAILEAMATAGRSVVFAGSIVIVSLLGMLLIGLSFLTGLALGSATSVLIALAAAITLVPALLGIMGKRIGKRAVRKAVSARETVWHRWARFVQRRAAVGAVVGTLFLVGLSVPILSMRLATTNLGTTAKTGTARVAYDELASAFGAGINGPLVVAIDTPTEASRAQVASLESRLSGLPGVANSIPAQFSADQRAAQIVLFPKSAPSDEATTQLVHRLRAALKSAGVVAHVGGVTASDVDFADLMGSRLPVFIGSVLAASFFLLMLVFRSVLVPLKAVLLNLLSIASAYGLMVMVFQWGWFGGVFGVDQGAPIEPWAPMMLFAIVFGLSMDYEVFLLSSVHERFSKTGDNSEAVVDGLATTARVITAAAAIMIAVFGAFVANDLRSIKLIGFGLAAAVLVDATIVRMLLVPATMELLGNKNWWMPRFLDRLLPHVRIEGSTEAPLLADTLKSPRHAA